MKSRYLDIYEKTKENICTGVYPVGEKLPSKRVLAEREGVSVITITHAYELLAEEGYIISKEKSGYFVSYNEANSFSDSTINKSSGYSSRRDLSAISHIADNNQQNTFSFSIYAKTARRVLSDYQQEIMCKSPGYGSEMLRAAISDYLIRYRDMYAKADNIIIGSGAEYLYGLIVQALGRDIIYGIESPSYHKIAQVYEAGGVRLEMLKLGIDGIDSSELRKTTANVLHITPYRSFPSGVTATINKKREYLRWSRENGAIIIEDDFESEFTPSRKPEETLYSMDDEGRVIYVNTFTCTIGPSIRIAYMVIPDAMMARFDEKIGFYSCPVPMLDQLILGELIENGDFVRHINRVRRNNRKKKGM